MLDMLLAAFGRYCYKKYTEAPFATMREWVWWKLYMRFG